jgi:hydroxyacylglutathione hydrolase
MMNIKQFRYPPDNLSYLLYGKNSAVAIDGNAVEAILAYMADKGLTLQFVANTHSHSDHTLGNRAILDQTQAEYLDNTRLLADGRIDIEGRTIEVYHTPGHTSDSIVFHCDNLLITGDTLFNGTVGNCFSGDLKGFYHSIKTLMMLPKETVIYAGHDYVRESMAFAKILEPENADIDAFLKRYDPDHVYSTLSEEYRINPFLRFNDENIVNLLEQRGLPTQTEYDRWVSIMSIE